MKLTDEMILKYHIEHDEQIEKTEEIFHKTFSVKVFSNIKVADGKREFRLFGPEGRCAQVDI